MIQVIDKARVMELVRQRLGDTVPMNPPGYAEGYADCAKLILRLLEINALPEAP